MSRVNRKKPRRVRYKTIPVLTVETFVETAIEIPSISDEPTVEISTYDSPGEINAGCAASKMGLRDYQEDTYQVATQNSYKFYAVYDGHGGKEVSHLLRYEFHNKVFEALNKIKGLKTAKTLTPKLINQVKADIENVFVSYDKYLYTSVLDRLSSNIGSTAIVVLDIADYLFFANLGDSRAILVPHAKVSTKPIFETKDHKPASERARVEAAGSYVMVWGVPRVGIGLAVSRAFGDFDETIKLIDGVYKGPDAPVSSLPDVTAVKKPAGISYVILASDGLWDAMSSAKAATYLDKLRFATGTESKEIVPMICETMVSDAIYKFGSKDNTTVMIVKVE